MRSLFMAILVFVLGGPVIADGHRGTADEAMEIIIGVSDLFESEGRDAVLAAIADTEGPFQDRDLFAMIWDVEGNVVGHGRNQQVVGTNRWDFQDVEGTYLTRLIVEAAMNGGDWVPYRFLDPTIGEQRNKTTFALPLDDELIVAVGIFADD